MNIVILSVSTDAWSSRGLHASGGFCGDDSMSIDHFYLCRYLDTFRPGGPNDPSVGHETLSVISCAPNAALFGQRLVTSASIDSIITT